MKKNLLIILDFLHGMLSPHTEKWRSAMRFFFLLYVLTFSFSSFLRDFFPHLCIFFLILYHLGDYKKSTWACFSGKKYFFFFYAFLGLGVIFSQNVPASLHLLLQHSYTSLALPFVTMESFRHSKELRLLAYTLLAALFLQGGNGIYQYITGYDFICNIAIMAGRLTGSFSDYRVGNYIAITLIPTISLFILSHRRGNYWHLGMLTLLMMPAAFLLFFTYTRTAYIILFAAFFLWTVIMRYIPWKFFLTSVVAFLALLPWLQTRFNWQVIRQDGRWDLWHLAVEVFKEFPFLGAGIGQYNAAFRALGLSPTKDSIDIEHPHNIYLQFLCENGVVGFALVMVFLLGLLWWGYSTLRKLSLPPYSAQSSQKNELALLWRVGAVYWCGWGAFLICSVVAHNFFQRWWLALVMALLGIMIGTITQLSRENYTQEQSKAV